MRLGNKEKRLIHARNSASTFILLLRKLGIVDSDTMFEALRLLDLRVYGKEDFLRAYVYKGSLDLDRG